MPERGWYSLTVRKETARRVREMAKTKGLTVDEYMNELMTGSSRSAWLTCDLCGAKVKAENMPKHIARVHPEKAGR